MSTKLTVTESPNKILVNVNQDGEVFVEVLQGNLTVNGSMGAGDVVGPANATDNAITRFDGITGKLIQNSGITIADGATGTLSGTNSGDVTVTDTDTIDLTIAGQSLSGAVRTQQSITSDASGIKLSGDSASPGNSQYYGTDGAGSKGFHALPVGTVTSVGVAGTDGIEVDSGSPVTGSGTITLGVNAATMKTTLDLAGTNTGDQNLFSTIAVSGQSNVVADTTSDTLTLVAGSNITITTDASTDAITINSTASGSGDVVGPGSATDNALARFDTTTGKLIQSGLITEDDDGNLSGVNFIQLDTTPTGSLTAQGQLGWNLDEETVDIQLNSFTLHVGEHTVYHAKNQTGSTIAKGVPVMFAGTDGSSGKLLIAPWNGTGPSVYFMGLTAEDLSDEEEGFVIAFGKIRGIQTDGVNYGQVWTPGEIIYLGTATGSLTDTQPAAPNPHVIVAAVVSAHASNGTLFIRPSLGSNIKDDEGVTITSLTSGQLLVANSAGTVFENKSVSGDATLANTGALTIANNAVTYAKMQDVTAASRLLGRGDSGSGDPQEIVIGTGLAMTGTTLSATGGGGGIGGSTGSTDRAVLVADGTGGSTLEATAVVIDGSESVISPTGFQVVPAASNLWNSTYGNQDIKFNLDDGLGVISQVHFDATALSASGLLEMTNPDATGTREILLDGVAEFTQLADTPASYTGQAGKVVAVKGAEDGLEFITVGGTGTVTSVAISGTDGIEVDSGSPITSSGTIQLGVNAATMKTTLDLTGTNTGDVTLAGTPDYITISGQTITRNAVDLASDITGTLPITNGGTGQTSQTAAFDALAPTTTKGDLIVHNGTDNVRVPVGGTNGHVLTVDSAEATGVKWAAGGGGGLTNITETLHTASPNNTVNAEQLEVTGGTTNVDLVLTPKGTGAFILGNEPDSTATGGNKRGVNAVDLQTIRSSQFNVASGEGSFAAGTDNKPQGNFTVSMGRRSQSMSTYAVSIGFACQANGTSSVAIGDQAYAGGSHSAAVGGLYADAAAAYSVAHGFASKADRHGMFAIASGYFSAFGDVQGASFRAFRKTTTNSAVELFLNGSSTRLTIPSGKVFSGTVNIVGVKSDGTAVARYLRQVTIKNVAGTTSLVGSVITLGTDEAAGTSVSITADDTNDALKIEVTGITSETWRWVATIEGAEVAYGN